MSVQVSNDKLVHLNKGRGHFLFNGFLDSMTASKLTNEEKNNIILDTIGMSKLNQIDALSRGDVKLMRDTVAREYNDKLVAALETGITEKQFNELTNYYTNEFDSWVGRGYQPLAVTDTRFERLHTMLNSEQTMLVLMDIGADGYSIPYEKTPFLAGDARELYDLEKREKELPASQRQLVISDVGTLLNDEELFSKGARNSRTSFLIAPYITKVNEIVRDKEGVADTSKYYVENARNFLAEQRKKNEENRRDKKANQKPSQKPFRTVPRRTNLHKAEFEYLYEDTSLANSEQSPKAIKQVENFLGGLISQSDMKELNTTMSFLDYSYSPEVMNRARGTLGHLFDAGIEYTVNSSSKYPHQLVARLEDGTGAEIRVLDKNEYEKLIGRVYTREGSFFYFKQGNEDTWSPENPYAIIDYVSGVSANTGYFPTMTKNEQKKSSQIYLDSVSRPVNFHPIIERMNSTSFRTTGAAEAALRDSIDTARMLFKEQLLHDDVEENNTELIDIQTALFVRIKEEDETLFEISKSNPELNYTVASDELREKLINEVVDAEIGSYENGFHLGRVTEYNRKISSFNPSERILTALKHVQYDVDNKIRGTDFATQTLKDRMITFDKSSAKLVGDKTLSPFNQEVMEHTLAELKNLGILGVSAKTGEYDTTLEPMVAMDKNGVMRWQGVRVISAVKNNPVFERVSSDIGQIFEPNEEGIIETKYNSGVNYGLIPGYQGHFQYSNISKPRMERFRATGMNQLMKRKISSKLREQVMRPRSSVSNRIQLGSDATALNKLYQGDVYAQRIDLDWYKTSTLSKEVKNKIIKTLSGRIRLNNSYGANATTFSVSERGNTRATDAAATISATVDHKNLRELLPDYNGYFDKTMTGTNYNQGLANYLAEGAVVNEDGSVTPAPLDENGEPTKAPLMDLDYFKYAKHNAWDRNQMASSQLTTAHGVDKARTALMTFGGWNMEDAYVVSKEFAERNMIPSVETGELRPLMIGDKISDFGGNKGIISLIIDRAMSADDAEKEQLTKEVAIMKANPDLDVIGSPYSMISRHNAGVILEMQESIKPVYDENGEMMAESGELNIIITNQQVDKKSQTYSQDDLALGRGRKFSSQLGWGMNELGADNLVKEVFQYNDNSWAVLREYLIVAGYDMEADGTLRVGYKSHGAEVRNQFEVNSKIQTDEFLKSINIKGGMLKLPFELDSVSKKSTDTISILDASTRSTTVLINEEQKDHRYTKYYGEIYRNSLIYMDAERLGNEAAMDNAKKNAQRSFTHLQKSVVQDKLGGMNGETSKHSFIRENLMSKKLPNTATSVISPDPRLPIGEISVSQDVHDTLGVKGNEKVLIHRDPVLRGGAARGVSTKVDKRLTGIAISPLITDSNDADFDGDTFGVTKAQTKAGQKDIDEKIAVEHHLIDKDSEEERAFLNLSMDVLSGALHAGIIKHPNADDEDALSPKQQLNQLFLDAAKLEPREKAVKEINRLKDVCLREGGFGSAGVYLSSKEKMHESFKKMVNDGAKGSPKALAMYMKYYNNEVTEQDTLDTQYATGAKSDFTGVAGTFSQNLMKSLRDTNPRIALETTYVITQGTLQIKHDAERGRKLDEILNHDLRGLLNGQSIDDKKRKSPLTKEQFKEEMRIVYNDKLEVDLREDTLNDLAELLSSDGYTVAGVERISHKLASPIDKIAYNGGLKAIHELAVQGVSLNQGDKSSLIVPKTIKTADETTILAKKGTQDKVGRANKESELEEVFKKSRAEAKEIMERQQEIKREEIRKHERMKGQLSSIGLQL